MQSTSTSELGFVELIAPDGLTHNANQQLASQCPGGKFTDVQNELSVRDFFFAHRNLRYKAAYCRLCFALFTLQSG
jgi:hypothetical protein